MGLAAGHNLVYRQEVCLPLHFSLADADVTAADGRKTPYHVQVMMFNSITLICFCVITLRILHLNCGTSHTFRQLQSEIFRVRK